VPINDHLTWYLRLKHSASLHNHKRMHLASLSLSSRLVRDLVRVSLLKLACDLISRHHAFCFTQGASPPLLLLLVDLLHPGALAHLPLVGVPLNLQLSDHLVNQQEEHQAPHLRSARGAHPCSARVPLRLLLDSQLSRQQVSVALPHPNVSFSSCSNLSHSPYQMPCLSTAPGTGTASPPYAPFQEKDTAGATTITQHFQTINAMPAYRNYSLEASAPIR
jgi:hypothetical protein